MSVTKQVFLDRLAGAGKAHVECREFSGIKKTARLYCVTHQVEYTQLAGTALRSAGCPECRRAAFRATRAASFIQKHRLVIAAKGLRLVEETYVTSKSPAKYECSHGTTWVVPEFAESNQHCCASSAVTNRKETKAMKGTRKRFLQTCKLRGIELLSKYETGKTLLVRCIRHNYEMRKGSQRIEYGKYNCPECVKEFRASGMNQRKTHAQFVLDLKAAGQWARLRPKDEYAGAFSKIRCKCRSCKSVWLVTPDSLLNMRSGCPTCADGQPYSQQELDLLDWVRSVYHGEVRHSDRAVLPGSREIDILIPDRRLAIEYNGMFWHSDLQKPPEYHAAKSRDSVEAGYRLIHVWEDDWLTRTDRIKSVLEQALGLTRRSIGARSLRVAKVRGVPKVVRSFYDRTHLQGKPPAAVITYALFDGDTLISSMSFDRVRSNRGQPQVDGEFELVRFSSVLGVHVAGGASRMFKAFVRDHKPRSVVSYSWNDYFDGSVYARLGFKCVKDCKHDYWPVVGGVRVHKSRTSRKRLLELVGDRFNPDLTERENCNALGILRCYDSGKKKWLWQPEVT